MLQQSVENALAAKNDYFCIRNKWIIMNKRAWLIPLLIVIVNALAVLIRWHSLQEMLPAHFDLQGNAGGSMPRETLLFYPLAGAVICGIAYAVASLVSKRSKNRAMAEGLRSGLIILTAGIALVILSSTMVTLTYGTTPVFMLAEPVILAISLIAFVICIVRARKER